MCTTGLHWIPIVINILITVAVIVCYIIATATGHIKELFPFISDFGGYIPEKNIFTQSLNVAAFLGVIMVYCWHRHVTESFKRSPEKYGKLHFVLAYTTLASGLLSAAGLALLASFPLTEVFTFHVAFANVQILSAILYGILASGISMRLSSSLWMVRSILSLFAFLLYAVGVALYIWWKLILKSPAHDSKNGIDITQAIVSICEWISVFCILLFFLTLALELRDYTISLKKVVQRKTDADVHN